MMNVANAESQLREIPSFQTQIPSSASSGNKSSMNEKDVFKYVLFHCVLIILCPISSFFLLKIYFFDGFLKLESLQSNLYSAFAAVVVLHVALGNFIYRAYFHTETIPGFDKLQKED